MRVPAQVLGPLAAVATHCLVVDQSEGGRALVTDGQRVFVVQLEAPEGTVWCPSPRRHHHRRTPALPAAVARPRPTPSEPKS